MSETKLIILIAAITILSAGCVNNSLPKDAEITPTPTPTLTNEAPPTYLYEIPSGYAYGTTQSYELYSNKIDKKFIRMEAIVFGEGGMYYNNESKKMERSLQVYGKYDDIIEIKALYITAPVDKIDGNIKQDSEVLIYGYFDNTIWFEGTNVYGTTIRQPWIFAHNVTAITHNITAPPPKIEPQQWTWEGKGNFKTPIFHINASVWRISWSNWPSDLPGGYDFEMTVRDSSNRTIRTVKGIPMPDGTSQGTEGIMQSGDFYLDVMTSQKYEIIVVELIE